MTTLIIRFLIQKKQISDEALLRKRYGIVSGFVGIVCNLLLFSGKLFAGLITSSVSIMADAINNLSDAGSSIATLLGFKLADLPPDEEHPFGHGRFEYIAGFIVSFIIILMGLELLKASVVKIFHPETIEFHRVSLLIMICSVGIKLWMCLFNKKIGKMIQSTTLIATAMDSLTDAIATSAVIFGMVIYYFYQINIDGYIGVVVAGFILYTGVMTAKDTLDPLLGLAPSTELVVKIREKVLSYDDILGVHDLIVHSYGAEKKLVSLHAEVSCHSDLLEIHNVIDTIERDIKEQFHCDAVIHMDPIDTEDEKTKEFYKKVMDIVKEVDDSLQIHDFRMICSVGETKLLFDIVVPFHYKQSDEALLVILQEKIKQLEGNCIPMITVDHVV